MIGKSQAWARVCEQAGLTRRSPAPLMISTGTLSGKAAGARKRMAASNWRRLFARETGRYGIRLNVVCPGVVVPPEEESISEESMWNQMRDIFTEDVLERVRRSYILRRMGTASEIANAGVFLASDAASFITGQTLSVSGGYTMI